MSKIDSIAKKISIDKGRTDSDSKPKAVVKGVKRRVFADVRKIEKKSAPKSLVIVGLAGLVFASLYLMKLFTTVPDIQYLGTTKDKIITVIVIGFLFFQYISYVTTVFKLASGLRGAWASMVRCSGSYVILMIISYTQILDFLPFNLVAFNYLELLVVMAVVTAYMFLGFVREFYTPEYADVAPMGDWLKFVFFQDPYGSEDITADIDVDIPA